MTTESSEGRGKKAFGPRLVRALTQASVPPILFCGYVIIGWGMDIMILTLVTLISHPGGPYYGMSMLGVYSLSVASFFFEEELGRVTLAVYPLALGAFIAIFMIFIPDF